METSAAPQHYTPVAMTIHWFVAASVVLTVVLALYLAQLDRGETKDALLGIHKSIGLTILLLTAVRGLWRLTHPAPPLPPSMTRLQRVLAHGTHALLYVLAIFMPISGYVAVAARGRETVFLGLISVPQWAPLDRRLAHDAESIHIASQYALYALVAAHVGAALYHHFVIRDDVLRRMWFKR